MKSKAALQFPGYRFFKEYATCEDKRQDRPMGTCVAINVAGGLVRPMSRDTVYGGRGFTGLGCSYGDKNAPIVACHLAIFYLRAYCRPVSETQAHQMHPALFDALLGGIEA